MSVAGSTVGAYRLEQFIGAGGMGEVYRAVDTRLGRTVAIKLLSGAMDPQSAGRFYNEARIQAGLRHPGIATLYEFLEFQGRPCIVMEYVEGETIADRLRSRGPMPVAEALSIFRKVAEAVAYIHAQGVVHRDLKANNIKLTPSGEVRILDFGIAKSPASARVTQIGKVIGTVENLAPEQIDGRGADARTDVWGLGILLYEVMSGRSPFEGSTVEVLYDRIRKTDCPPPPAHAPLVLRCLEKDPNRRFQTASELLAAIDRGPEAPPRVELKLPRRWIVVSAAAFAVLLLLFVLVRSFVDSSSSGAQSITVDVVGGRADVWRDGRRLGRTPFEMHANPGDHVELMLKREQCFDLPVQFDVSERKVYSYTMEPLR